jgi:hypothetical protein
MIRWLAFALLVPLAASAQTTNYWIGTNNALASAASSWSLGEIPTNPAHTVYFTTNGLLGSNTSCIVDCALTGAELRAENYRSAITWSFDGYHSFSNVWLMQPAANTLKLYWRAGTLTCNGSWMLRTSGYAVTTNDFETQVVFTRTDTNQLHSSTAYYQPRMIFRGGATNSTNYGVLLGPVVVEAGVLTVDVNSTVNAIRLPVPSVVASNGANFATPAGRVTIYSGAGVTNSLNDLGEGGWLRSLRLDGVWRGGEITNSSLSVLALSGLNITLTNSVAQAVSSSGSSIAFTASLVNCTFNDYDFGFPSTLATYYCTNVLWNYYGNYAYLGWYSNVFAANCTIAGQTINKNYGVFVPASIGTNITIRPNVVDSRYPLLYRGESCPPVVFTNAGYFRLGVASACASITQTSGAAGTVQPVGYTLTVSNLSGVAVQGSNSSIYALNAFSPASFTPQSSVVYATGTTTATNYYSLVPVGSCTLTGAAITVSGTLTSQSGALLNAAGGTLTLSNPGLIDGNLQRATVTGNVLRVDGIADQASGQLNTPRQGRR